MCSAEPHPCSYAVVMPRSACTWHVPTHPCPPRRYFAPAGALSATRGTTMRSLKHALGPSFGSLCVSSLVLTISQIMRQALEQ